MVPYGASNFYINDTVVSMVSSSWEAKPSDSVEVIVDNLDKFQGMYNEIFFDKIPFHASSVENVMDILILGDWKKKDVFLSILTMIMVMLLAMIMFSMIFKLEVKILIKMYPNL